MATVTYCPEDNKLRLYVGRVPRDEYEELRKAGFVSTPKQDCDFAAPWTPSREDLAARYLEDGEDIGDEDYSPADRAADRAERFGGYLEKRISEAGESADRFEAGPTAFGHQNRDRAERAAKRHDATRVRAVSQWSKAEYWQRRTSGVIANALHRYDPATRRGRIDNLEKELRRCGSERWAEHLRFRLQYEKAMLENEGGRAGEVEMKVGGLYRGARIIRVHRSPATKLITSLVVLIDGEERVVDVTRDAGEGIYRDATPREAEEFAQAEKERKRVKAASTPKAPPIINPSPEDAAKLQTFINAAYRRRMDRRGADSVPINATQAAYTSQSKGEYAICEMFTMHEMIDPYEGISWRGSIQRYPLFRVRLCKSRDGGPRRVVILTDKPFTSVPWQAVEEAKAKCPTPSKLVPFAEELNRISGLATMPDDPRSRELVADALYAGLFYLSSSCQFGFNEAGHEWYRAQAGQREAA